MIAFVLTALAAVLVAPIQAQQTYYFSGAVTVGGGGGTGSPAVQAQCPADHPISCTNIQQPDSCCPSGNYCAWANSQVGCCPEGQTCNGWANAGGGAAAAVGGWAPSTTWVAPSTTYIQPSPTTPMYGSVVVVPAGYTTPLTVTTVVTSQQNGGEQQQGYCLTITARGPNLPAVARGNCGNVLIVAADAQRVGVALMLMLVSIAVGGLLMT
ncbi:hypothetical protein K470DRAFT_217771 [Piedraia hortae CBS 480.64]|uniref:GPI anchored protein n=1 Tax=Piedraia hortae CBS 480.64 TaxID=1314780 RepID=A0A6A7BXZ6_9PEZI|nr:hypothetical protein K470DRAFT_217771 [Piedraia hortae CBS 480.64]